MFEKKTTITSPDDFHLHLREGKMMKAVLPYTSAIFSRALIMPNLTSPIDTVSKALTYRNQILKALPKGHFFDPLMTLYMTKNFSAKEIIKAKQNPFILGVKYYPAGVTTNAYFGFKNQDKLFSILETMEKEALPLMIHGEIPDESVDVFDLEKFFIDKMLKPIVKKFKKLKITLEHITTKEACEFIEEHKNQLGATITIHHLLLNRNDLLLRKIKPHYYCLPILKREVHRRAIVKAATSGKKCFFLGTDSAPHSIEQKQSSCGCAGIFSAPIAMQVCADIFEKENKLQNLEAFSSLNGAFFYGLKKNNTKITLIKKRITNNRLCYYDQKKFIRPFLYKKNIEWSILEKRLLK